MPFYGLNPGNNGTPCVAGGSIGADDEIRTRDPHLGKVMLYQLSYVRVERPPYQPARPIDLSLVSAGLRT